MFTKREFRSIKKIVRAAIDSTADTITGLAGHDVSVIALTGVIAVNPLVAAVLTTGIPLVVNVPLDLRVESTLSMISDGSGGTYLIIVWGE